MSSFERLPLSFCYSSFGHLSLVQRCKRNDIILVSQLFRKEILNAQKSMAFAELMRDFHSIWHLCEIVFFGREFSDAGNLGSQLVAWLNDNYPLDSMTTVAELEALISPRDDPRFWAIVKMLISRGDFSTASKLLDENVECDKSLIETLSSMPGKSGNSSFGSDHVRSWHLWQENCKFHLQNRLRKQCSSETEFQQLESIYNILCGNVSHIVSHYDSSWKDCLVTLISFTTPICTFQTLKDILDKYFVDLKPSDLRDSILLAILEFDVSKFIKLSSEMNLWLISHLFPIIEASGIVETELEKSVSFCLGEDFLLRFAEQIVQISEDYWTVSFSYLSLCGEKGRRVMENLIVSLPWQTSQRSLQKIIFICEKYAMEVEKRNIFQIVARYYFDQKRFGPCLWYYLKGKNFEMAQSVIEHFCLMKLSGKIDFNDGVLFGISPRDFEECEGLLFLKAFCYLLESLQEERFEDAGNVILDLLLWKSGSSSRKFWPYLLMKCLPILEARKIIFNEQDTLELMRCLEDQSQDDLETFQDESGNSKWSVLRLALLRNLARSQLCLR